MEFEEDEICDLKDELDFVMEQDIQNMPIFKLVLATIKDLQWDWCTVI